MIASVLVAHPELSDAATAEVERLGAHLASCKHDVGTNNLIHFLVSPTVANGLVHCPDAVEGVVNAAMEQAASLSTSNLASLSWVISALSLRGRVEPLVPINDAALSHTKILNVLTERVRLGCVLLACLWSVLRVVHTSL